MIYKAGQKVKITKGQYEGKLGILKQDSPEMIKGVVFVYLTDPITLSDGSEGYAIVAMKTEDLEIVE